MTWRTGEKERKTAQRKGSWLVGLVCGPVFALIFGLLLFLPPLLFKLILNPWLCLFGTITATAPLADRIWKTRSVTAEQFAGP